MKVNGAIIRFDEYAKLLGLKVNRIKEEYLIGKVGENKQDKNIELDCSLFLLESQIKIIYYGEQSKIGKPIEKFHNRQFNEELVNVEMYDKGEYPYKKSDLVELNCIIL